MGKGENAGNQHFLLFLQYFPNSIPNDKILNWSKFKVLADDKINLTEKIKFVPGRIENIFGKGQNAGNQHFLFFPLCLPKSCSTGSFKVVIKWKRLK